MKMRVGILVYLLVTSILVQANDTIPKGTWEVVRVFVEKNTDGKTEKKSYKTVSEIKSHIPCPQVWIVNEENIRLRYPDGIEDTAENKLEEGQLTVYAYDGCMFLYQCSINDGNLVLTVTHNYINISPAGQVEEIVEKRVITLKKRKTNEETHETE